LNTPSDPVSVQKPSQQDFCLSKIVKLLRKMIHKPEDRDRLPPIIARHISDHDLTMSNILNRGKHFSRQRQTQSRPVTPIEDFKPIDLRWISDETLTYPLQNEDKWWLSGGVPESFLDTRAKVFGRKTVFLVDKKIQKSENDLVHYFQQFK